MARDHLFAREVGRRLNLVRCARNLSKKRLSALVGVNPETITNVELGRHGPALDISVRLCDALDLGIADLVAGLPDVKDPELRSLWSEPQRSAPASGALVVDHFLNVRVERREGDLVHPFSSPF